MSQNDKTTLDIINELIATKVAQLKKKAKEGLNYEEIKILKECNTMLLAQAKEERSALEVDDLSPDEIQEAEEQLAMMQRVKEEKARINKDGDE